MRSPLILVVQDDPDANARVCGILGKAGYQTTSVHNVEQALEMAARLRPAIILVDLFHPGLDGFELCQRLKSRRTTAPIPVIGMTGYPYSAIVEQAVHAGFGAILPKPFSSEVLLSAVQVVLEIARAVHVRPGQWQNADPEPSRST